MAEDTKPAAPTAKTPPSRELLQKHINNVKAETLKLVGTNKLNPYLYIKRNITPVEDELAAAKEVTSALADKVIALKAAVLPKDLADFGIELVSINASSAGCAERGRSPI